MWEALASLETPLSAPHVKRPLWEAHQGLPRSAKASRIPTPFPQNTIPPRWLYMITPKPNMCTHRKTGRANTRSQEGCRNYPSFVGDDPDDVEVYNEHIPPCRPSAPQVNLSTNLRDSLCTGSPVECVVVAYRPARITLHGANRKVRLGQIGTGLSMRRGFPISFCFNVLLQLGNAICRAVVSCLIHDRPLVAWITWTSSSP
jgi:hypothetical protein